VQDLMQQACREPVSEGSGIGKNILFVELPQPLPKKVDADQQNGSPCKVSWLDTSPFHCLPACCLHTSKDRAKQEQMHCADPRLSCLWQQPQQLLATDRWTAALSCCCPCMVPDTLITAGTADNGRIALNPEKQEALLEACNAGDEALVRSLLAEGNVSLDIPDVEGWTALHWCIAHPAVVKLVLTKADTQIDARDREGEQCSASAELTSHIRRTFHNSSFRCSM